MTATILVIEDEPQIRKFLTIALEANGFTVALAATAAQGLDQTRTARPDLVILDLGLPDQDGQDVISAIRQYSPVPIIVVSVRGHEFDKVEALDRGANDYMVKPFGTAELLARIRSRLRGGETDAPLRLGRLSICPHMRKILRDGQPVRLSRQEWQLLMIFAKSPDRVLTHGHLMQEMWGLYHGKDVSALRVSINQLRRKLEPDPSHPTLLITDSGVGYRLKAD